MRECTRVFRGPRTEPPGSDGPVLSDATGSTRGLTIPTQYRGDQLATVEATYADGFTVGPA
ncbi:hypothetical protein [Streptomyces sp. SAS_260]|uniref:hypothetical protein n=1 Tax=Streptomyces sp. SAS_260 TaxID=3412751 RepID=UPI00403C154F